MEPIFRRDAVADGVTDWELHAGVQSGALTRIGRGAYVPSGALADLTPEQRHRLTAIAAYPTFASGTILSHRSAAALHGLPLWNVDLSHIDVTRSGITTRSTRQTNFYGHVLTPDEVVRVDGIPVTSLNRTVLDLACSLPFEEAVVTGDAALRLGATQPAVPRRKNAAKARIAIGFMNGRAESAGESRSRVLFHRRGVPMPLLQQRIIGDAYLARVDFLWPEFSLVGEFDGEGKYRGRFGDGENALVSEKYREDAIRALGWTVVRWSWDDLDDPRAFLARLGRAIDAGRPHRAFAA